MKERIKQHTLTVIQSVPVTGVISKSWTGLYSFIMIVMASSITANRPKNTRSQGLRRFGGICTTEDGDPVVFAAGAATCSSHSFPRRSSLSFISSSALRVAVSAAAVGGGGVGGGGSAADDVSSGVSPASPPYPWSPLLQGFCRGRLPWLDIFLC